MPSSANVSEILNRYKERSREQQEEIQRIWNESVNDLKRNLKLSLQGVESTIEDDTERLKTFYKLHTGDLKKEIKKYRIRRGLDRARRWATLSFVWILIVALPVLSVWGAKWYWDTRLTRLRHQVSEQKGGLEELGKWGIKPILEWNEDKTEAAKWLMIPHGFQEGVCNKKPCIRVND